MGKNRDAIPFLRMKEVEPSTLVGDVPCPSGVAILVGRGVVLLIDTVPDLKTKTPSELNELQFPIRPGKPPCPYYLIVTIYA